MYINKEYEIKDEYPQEIKNECLILDRMIENEEFEYFIQIDFIEIVTKAHYLAGNISERDFIHILRRYCLR